MIETTEGMIKGGIEEDRDFLNRYRPEKDLEEFKTAWKALEAHGGARQQAYEPHYEGSPVVMGPPGAQSSIHSKHSYLAQTGHHLTPQPLSDGRNVFEALGAGYTLLAFGAPEGAVAPFLMAARDLGVQLQIVLDTYGGGREAYEAHLILVRPDQYVVWAGDEAPDDAAAILRRVTGRT
jgi:hypothetical protein